MKLVEFISLDSIHVDIDVDSKKNLFKCVSTIFSKNNSERASIVVEKLNERERLGSTGVGNGVAIPHSKISYVDKTKVFFLKLKSAIDFSSSDKRNVDLVFVILAPIDCQSEHLLILSSISSFLKNDNLVKKLRNLRKPEEILKFLSNY